MARPSQALPSVRCSSCGLPVPLDTLGDHVCPPTLPAVAKPPMSPKSAAVLLPQRLQSLVARSATPPRKSSAEKPSGEVDPNRPPLINTATSSPKPPERISATLRDAIPPALQRVRTPSNASRLNSASPARPSFPIPFAESPGHVVPERPVAFSPARRDSPTIPLSPRSPLAGRPPSNITPSNSSERARTPSTLSTSLSKSRPSLDKLRRSPDIPRSAVDSQRPPLQLNPAAPPGPPFSRPPKTAVLPQGTIPFPSSAPVPLTSVSARQPPTSPVPYGTEREVDTKTGGEAGMAGVGRRGFAAAARAAMFSASLLPSHQSGHVTALGNSYRANAPQYLDTSTTFAHVMRAAVTPPLSPNSAHTPSPVSPFPTSPVSLRSGTPVNGKHPDLPSPHDAVFQPSLAPASNDKVHSLSFSPSDVRIASPSRSPSPIPNPFERRVSGETISHSPMPTSALPLPFLDILKPSIEPERDSDDESVYTTHSDPKKDGGSRLSTGSEAGLAYAQDLDDDTPVVMPLDIRKSSVNGSKNKVKFPTSSSQSERYAPSRQISNSSMRSAMSSRSGMTVAGPLSRSISSATNGTVRSVGALERAMETLIEEGASVSILASGSVLASIGSNVSGRVSGKPSRSNTVAGTASPDQRPPKLPTRSHTNPSHPHIHSERAGLAGEVVRIRNKGSTKRKDRICAGCNFKIEDGRWIQTDGGNVLCERCWKNMYLPKCRRCNLPIEKQAVSSSDGQLKGKYHKGCFNCHTCQKPFPDREFYVFDGKPFCAYHYHEANNSLCGAHSCGQPIEGPCAVTHSGKRYHPGHLLCEFEDGCKERLEEYWEVDGQMLCERHATVVGNHEGGSARGDDPVGDAQMQWEPRADEGRMMKRMTRFIDLGAGGDGEFDIR